MDPTAQNNQPVQQPAASQVPVQNIVQQPISVGKESSPVNTLPKPEQFMQETAPIVEVPSALREAGVESQKTEEVMLAEEVKKAGVTPSGIGNPLPTEPKIKFPLTEAQAKEKLGFHKKMRDSITWLAALILRQMQKVVLQQQREAKA